MKKNIFVGCLLTLFIFGFVLETSAGLINYDRKNNKSSRSLVKGDKGKGDKAGMQEWPEWAKSEPKVTNRLERQYDVNRDGMLQTAEVKIFLRDVLDEIKEKGQYSVYNSDILKEYDKNNDRIISKYEMDGIISHVR